MLNNVAKPEAHSQPSPQDVLQYTELDRGRGSQVLLNIRMLIGRWRHYGPNAGMAEALCSSISQCPGIVAFLTVVVLPLIERYHVGIHVCTSDIRLAVGNYYLPVPFH